MSTPTSGDVAAVLNAAAQIGMLIVVGIGVAVAYQQLNAWRTEARTRRRSEVAEDLIIAAYNVSDILKGIRSPFDRIPVEKANDKKYAYKRRYERIVDSNELFKELRQAQIRTSAVIGDSDVDEAVDILINIRGSVATAIEILSDYESEDVKQPESRDHIRELRQTMYGSYGPNDEIGAKQLGAIELIDDKLRVIARLESE